jgi:hypothetical protein
MEQSIVWKASSRLDGQQISLLNKSITYYRILKSCQLRPRWASLIQLFIGLSSRGQLHPRWASLIQLFITISARDVSCPFVEPA